MHKTSKIQAKHKKKRLITSIKQAKYKQNTSKG